jgi:hypothetical protein
VAVAETVYPGNPLGLGRAGAIGSPYQFLLDDDTSLRIISANSVTGVVIGINGLRLDEHGLPQTINEIHTPNTDRSSKTQDYRIGRGALLRLTLFVTAGAPLSGQTYVIAQLIRGITGQKIVLGTLLAGYVTSVQAVGFPGSPIVPSTAGEPAVRFITGTVPVVGANFSETVPTGARWQLLTCWAALLTNAVPANREAWMHWLSGAAQFWASLPSIDEPASQQYIYVWQQLNQLTGSTVTAHVTQPLPPANILLAGQTFNSFVNGMQAGDSWSAPVYMVKEWLEVN